MSTAPHVVFVTNDGASLWTLIGHIPTCLSSFAANEEGVAAFDDLLPARANATFFVLTDLLEEDYRIETLPPVALRDRPGMVRRRLDKLYRDSLYRCALPLGRSSEGRRDLRYLMGALSNGQPLDLWLDRIRAHDLKLAGVYSVALLLSRHANRLAPGARQLIVVSRQGEHGLRQSQFIDGVMHYSRLSQVEDSDIEALPEQLIAESLRARQYLASIRAIGRGEALDVRMLCAAHERDALRRACPDSENLHFTFVTLSEVAPLFGGTAQPDEGRLEPLLIGLLARKQPRNLLAPDTARQAYLAAQWQRRLYGGGLAALLTGALAAGILGWQTSELDAETVGLARRIAIAQQTIRANQVDTGSGDLSPTEMKHTVEAYDALVTRWPRLDDALQMVSNALADFPMVEIDQLGWMVTPRRDALPDGFEAGDGHPPASAAPDASTDGEGTTAAPRHVLIAVEGRLIGYGSRYREALQQVEAIAAHFRNRGAQVDLLALPIDIRPERDISLSTLGGQREVDASFKLRIVLPATEEAQTP